MKNFLTFLCFLPCALFGQGKTSFGFTGASTITVVPSQLQANGTTPTASLFYRGDGSWQSAGGGGSGYVSEQIILGTNTTGPDLGKIVISNLWATNNGVVYWTNRVLIPFSMVSNPPTAIFKFTNYGGGEIRIFPESTNGSYGFFESNNCWAGNGGLTNILTNGDNFIGAVDLPTISGATTNVYVFSVPSICNVGTTNAYTASGR